MKQLLIAFGFLFLCSCRQNNSAFRVATFRDVPREIMAGSFFSETQQDLDKGNYLFVQDYDSTGFIMANDKLLKVKLKHSVIDSVGNTMDELFEREGYKVAVKVQYVNDAGDKDYDFEGRIRIEDKRGDTITKNILGYDLVE